MKAERLVSVGLVGIIAVLVGSGAYGRQYRNSEGNTESTGVVIETNDKPASMTNPMAVAAMPFVRATRDPVRFEGITTTAKQFAITRPAGATAYRFVNPCDVDVRIGKVASMSESITQAQGTLYLARTSEVLGSSGPQYVSLIAMDTPSKPCAPELVYGNGS